ncbi:macoilin-1 isoform X1 [Dendroctonus ponderosae]|uniref:macoilin-1 isoform X1 n=1 Tax=Dendroctonus ponderosae TaxID=77166 RepID=UPI002034D84F|nr:macoilin-1 isoform X1 [Dendroctonus ponderosae]
MKRRNVELAKMRRPMKKNKITEGFYGSALLYLKFLILWILVILADFILEFRFEFLWPFYLVIRTLYDSYRYQGLLFSAFFVAISLTSDMLCYFFIPVHWLFFAASTYVWVQYVWHTDKGICTPTIILWILFVYLEAAIRLKDVKHLPGHLDLCRPFAAHCIGYPVVTLGFGFKTYVGYRMRQRKQQHVAKENVFYMQIMQQALPAERPPDPPSDQVRQSIAPIVAIAASSVQNNHKVHNHSHKEKNGHIPNGTIPNGVNHGTRSHKKSAIDKSRDHTSVTDRHIKINHSHSNGSVVDFHEETTDHEPKQVKRRDRREQDKEREAHEYLQRLETDTRRLKSDLQQSRASEQDLRLQVASLTTCEKSTKGELSLLQRQVDDLQERLQNAQSAKQTDKQTIATLERRLTEERRLRANVDSQLAQERKNRKQEEARLAQVTAQQSSRTECTDLCKARRRELEAELTECRQAQRWAEERLFVRCKTHELEKQAIGEQARDRELLMAALSTVQEKNSHLENALSAETRIKLDLFSALGDAKRHLEISQNANRTQEKEIEALKGKIAQVLAVMPNDSFEASPTPSHNSPMSRVRLAESPPAGLSKLDPNATAYTPKNSTPNTLIASTEA